VCVFLYIYVGVYVCMYVCVCVFLYIHVGVYVCMYVCVCVSVYLSRRLCRNIDPCRHLFLDVCVARKSVYMFDCVRVCVSVCTHTSSMSSIDQQTLAYTCIHIHTYLRTYKHIPLV
jgi:hypothetical protein